jgi:hypothetical protein
MSSAFGIPLGGRKAHISGCIERACPFSEVAAAGFLRRHERHVSSLNDPTKVDFEDRELKVFDDIEEEHRPRHHDNRHDAGMFSLR